jgi:2-(1,2-epoxy-1,2-dihydrophenyl)acetyl-CoA isomerase
MTEALILDLQVGRRDVAVLALNRPAAMNSFTTAMHAELMAALNAAAADPSVRCVILTGQGRGFCAGPGLERPGRRPAGQDLGALIGAYYKPAGAAHPQHARAGDCRGERRGRRRRRQPGAVLRPGAGRRSANFIQAFAKIGLLPDTGGTWLLAAPGGLMRARMGMAMLGDKLPADAAAHGPDLAAAWPTPAHGRQAEALGARSWPACPLKRAGGHAPGHCSKRSKAWSLDDGARPEEARQQTQAGQAHDYLEGVEAFRNKRAPVFKDR